MLNNKKLIWILLSAIAVVSVVAYTMINGANNAVTSAINDATAWGAVSFLSRSPWSYASWIQSTT